MLTYIFSIFKKNKEEVESLNGLRALAILLVVFFHTWNIFNGIHSDRWKNIFDNFNSGVDLFFILSGYLIYGGLFKEFEKNGSISVKSFFIKRALRILPAFYFALAVIFLYTRKQVLFAELHPPSDPNVLHFWQQRSLLLPYVWSDIFFLSNYIEGIMVVDWSLAVENHFYLLLPIAILLGLLKLDSKKRIILFSFLYLIPTILRLVGAYHGLKYDFIHATHNRFDSILVGIIVFEILCKSLSLQKTYIALLSLLMISLLIAGHSRPIESWFGKSIAINFQNIGFGILLFLCLNQRSVWTRLFEFSIFRPIARISYSMYLWNIVGIGVGAGLVAKNGISFSAGDTIRILLASFIVTILVSWILYLLIEKPFVNWKNSKERNRSHSQ